MKIILFVSFVFVNAVTINAQVKKTEHVQQIWSAWFNQTRFTNKWGMWAELQVRTKDDFVNNFSQSIARFGATYYIDNQTKLTAGYALVNQYPLDASINITRPEHRLWQQLQWHTNYGKNKMMQWIRLEERYRRKVADANNLANGYNFNYRIRYNMLYSIPLSKRGAQPNTFSLVMNDEVHINFGKEIVNNYFDQNRFFVGLAYHVNKHDNLQFGYMNVFQQLPAGNQYRSTDVIRLFYFQNLDWRKK